MNFSTKINARVQAQAGNTPHFFSVAVSPWQSEEIHLKIAEAYFRRNYNPAPGQKHWFRIICYTK
jgi:hypothetical protein